MRGKKGEGINKNYIKKVIQFTPQKKTENSPKLSPILF